MLKFNRLGIAAAAACLSFAAPVAAEPILLGGDDVGDSFSITFDSFVDGGSSLDGLSSQLDLTLQSIIDGVYTFGYTISNTGSTTDSVSSRVSGFAFNTDPDITSVSSDGDFDNSLISGRFPNGIGTVDVCFKDSSSGSCAGGGSGGVFDGESGSGTLSLAFDSAPTTLTLDDFFVRYQSVTGIDYVGSASGRQTSTTTTSTSSGGQEVPAPGMLAIFGMALLALFGLNRRRKLTPYTPAATPAFA